MLKWRIFGAWNIDVDPPFLAITMKVSAGSPPGYGADCQARADEVPEPMRYRPFSYGRVRAERGLEAPLRTERNGRRAGSGLWHRECLLSENDSTQPAVLRTSRSF